MSTFNVCNEDRLNVMGFILPGSQNESEFMPHEEVEIDPFTAYKERK